MEAYLDAIYYKNNPHQRPRPQRSIEPVSVPIVEETFKSYKNIDDDDDDIQDIINKIINKKPSVKKTRDLLKKYCELKEEEYSED